MCLMSSHKGIDIWLEIGEFQAQVSTHFQVRFDNFGITNSSDVTKDVKISDKDLCNTFIKLLEESRILSN
ncbi:hypothetical protein T02_14602 [Trichinella nativa]|uniref:Uncharacterized protein n=1 Tax=Trichinella nativa TaxID=6335 RepID=A0A0V1KWF9_9BILA|nr:hypothetical protein T02_14602 [Trichinella nativa]